jgi:hypothetical protein
LKRAYATGGSAHCDNYRLIRLGEFAVTIDSNGHDISKNADVPIISTTEGFAHCKGNSIVEPA